MVSLFVSVNSRVSKLYKILDTRIFRYSHTHNALKVGYPLMHGTCVKIAESASIVYATIVNTYQLLLQTPRVVRSLVTWRRFPWISVLLS